MSDETQGPTPAELINPSSSESAMHARLRALMAAAGAVEDTSGGGMILPGNGGPGKRAEEKPSPKR